MSSQASSQGSSGFRVDEEMAKGITIHKNISQEVIIITVDRIKLCLGQYERLLTAKTKWHVPLSVFLAVLPSLLAAQFTSSFGIKPEVWEAMFRLIAVGSFFWFLAAVLVAVRTRWTLRSVRGDSALYIVQKLKESAPSEPHETLGSPVPRRVGGRYVGHR